MVIFIVRTLFILSEVYFRVSYQARFSIGRIGQLRLTYVDVPAQPFLRASQCTYRAVWASSKNTLKFVKICNGLSTKKTYLVREVIFNSYFAKYINNNNNNNRRLGSVLYGQQMSLFIYQLITISFSSELIKSKYK